LRERRPDPPDHLPPLPRLLWPSPIENFSPFKTVGVALFPAFPGLESHRVFLNGHVRPAPPFRGLGLRTTAAKPGFHLPGRRGPSNWPHRRWTPAVFLLCAGFQLGAASRVTSPNARFFPPREASARNRPPPPPLRLPLSPNPQPKMYRLGDSLGSLHLFKKCFAPISCLNLPNQLTGPRHCYRPLWFLVYFPLCFRTARPLRKPPVPLFFYGPLPVFDSLLVRLGVLLFAQSGAPSRSEKKTHP